MRLLLALLLCTLSASGAIENDKSLLLETSPASKIIKSPTAEAIKKAEKLLSNGNEAIKAIPRSAVLDANASTLIRKAMDIEAGVKSSKYTQASTTETPVSAPTISIEKPATKYFEIIDRCYSSLENDSWADATANLNEVLNYFHTERNLHGKHNPMLSDYCDLSVAFSFYLAAGTELDEAEQPNYEHAKSMFTKARDNAQKIKTGLGAGAEGAAMSQLIDKFVKKLNTEILYIEDMLKS